jgi:hypothetical protein
MKFTYLAAALALAEFPIGNPREPNMPGRRLHMPGVAEFAIAEGQTLTALDAALTNLGTGVIALLAMIVAFQNSPGTLSAADQASLDALEAHATALVAQAGAISTTPPGAIAPVTPLPLPTPVP